MDIGLHIASFTWGNDPAAIGPTFRATAEVADQAGFSSLHVMDHFFQLDAYFPAEEPMLEGYTALGFAAAATDRIRLGLLVGGVTYRHPGMLAKTITTLDVLSGGRAEFGIGAGWYEREHVGLGIPFPSTKERFEWLEETLQICLQMWSGEVGEYHGDHFTLRETLNQPPAISRPHPPILIGGGGEKKTLRLVAEYAQGSNIIVTTADEAAHKFAVLRKHCEEVGRDYDEIERTLLYSGASLLGGDVDAFVEEMKPMAAAGVQRVMVMPFGPDPVGFVERASAAVTRLAEL